MMPKNTGCFDKTKDKVAKLNMLKTDSYSVIISLLKIQYALESLNNNNYESIRQLYEQINEDEEHIKATPPLFAVFKLTLNFNGLA